MVLFTELEFHTRKYLFGKAYGLNSHLTSLQCACRLKSLFEKFLSKCLVLSAQGRVSSCHLVPSRAISCLACQTVLMPRSRLVDFNKFYYNLKVTRGGHKFQHESTGTRAQGTKAQVLDMLHYRASVKDFRLEALLSPLCLHLS